MLKFKLVCTACILVAALAPAAATIKTMEENWRPGAQSEPDQPADKSNKAGAAKKIKREGPLKNLPSQPGPQMEKIVSLGDDSWVQLSTPKADPKWGVARGRSWGGAAFSYAPDLGGAFFFGEGPHAHVKPDGHVMDDLWFYDSNANAWIAVHPGTDPKTFTQRVKDKELLIDERGFLVDKDKQPIPVHTHIHAWGFLTYDSDLCKFAFYGGGVDAAGLGLCRYYLGGANEMAEGLNLLDAQKIGKPVSKISPWFYNSITGKFELDAVKDESVDAGDFPLLQYVKSRKQYFLGGSRGVYWYDPEKRTWTRESDKGNRPGGYDHGGCYDPKRDCIYMGPGQYNDAAFVNKLYVYDIKSKTWTIPATKGTPPQSFSANGATACYDAANDVFVILQRYEGKVFVYDPDTNTWADSPIPDTVLKCMGFPSFHGFYDAKLNVYFYYVAADGDDGGIMWAYRYKNPKPGKKQNR